MKKILVLILSAFVINGCATQQTVSTPPKRVPNIIVVPVEIKHLVLQNGVTTKMDVLNLLGQPERIGYYEKDYFWHYRGNQTRNLVISVIDKQNIKLVYNTVDYFDMVFDVKTGLLLRSNVSTR
jgi:hypothetical protein